MTTPWKILLGSVAGTSHLCSGEPCQDYGHALNVPLPSGDVLVASCADGAGSASRAAAGANLACLACVHLAAETLRTGERLDAGLATACFEQARRRLAMEACLAGVPIREYACTLLLAVIADKAALFAQIGDGAVVYRSADGYRTAVWPQTGEYASTTYFLTGSDFASRMAVSLYEGAVRDVALLTDGLQPLALNYASQSVHAPFFEPMFRSLREGCPADLEQPLRRFLDSGPVNDRTDDDKTLILATR